MVGVAAVEPVGDPAQILVVGVDVGVQQQQRNPADLRLPHLRVHFAPARHRDVHQHRLAVGAGEQLQRQRAGIDHRVVLDLPAVQ